MLIEEQRRKIIAPEVGKGFEWWKKEKASQLLIARLARLYTHTNGSTISP